MKTTNTILAFLTVFFMSTATWAADVTVNTFDSQGNPIAGVYKVKLGPNHIKHAGNTAIPSGTTLDLTVGNTYTIWAQYNSTSTERITLMVTSAGHTINFNTTNVKFHFSGGYLNYRGSGSWKSFGKSGGEWNDRELFPNDFYGNTMRIQTGYKWNDRRGIEFEIDYSGETSIEKTLAVLRVHDHNGDPIQGATARGGYTSIGWHVSGSTNANGLLIDIRDGKRTSLLYEARVNGTTATEGPKDPTLDSYYLFQTAELRVRMETCSGNPVDGGSVRFKNGLYKRWLNNNNAGQSKTGNAGPGEVAGEVFPGTYDVDMIFRHMQNTKTATVTAPGTVLTFKTTNVALTYSGSIIYKAAGGTYSSHYVKPSMEFLPGDYEFITSGGTLALTVGDCNSPISKALAIVKVLDCNGQYQAGVDIKWYKWGQAGNQHNAGTTTSGGPMLVVMDGNVNHAGIVAKYLGQSDKLHQFLSSNSIFIFQMIDVELVLNNYNNTAVLAPQSMKFYVHGKAGNKMTFDASQHMCLLPGKYGFVVKYNNTYQTKPGINVSVSNPVVFQTGLIANDNACSFNPTKYYRYGAAGTKYTFTDPMEFMPGKVGVLSSSNPTRLVTVTAGGIHTLSGNCPVLPLARAPQGMNATSSGFKFYPNPASREVNIEADVPVNVYNMTGKIMYTGTARTLHVSDWASGIYFMRAGNEVRKLIIK